ncbi:MAG: hypothetical protein H6R10_1347 [Rhodocyclaceae bacterium]|nr:hypothetical protein [Rhodocyclaceae bacterium]
MSGLPKGWCSAELGSLIERIEAGLNVKCEERPPLEGEKGLVKISAVTWGRFDEEQSKTLPADTPVTETVRIRPGDLLFSRANTIELVGATVLVGNISKCLYLSDKVLRLVVPEVTRRWVNYAMKTAHTRKVIQEASSGNQLSMRNISQEKLRQINIPIAPLPEQKRIADKLDSALARVDACRDRLDRIPALLKRFRQSILAAATSGRLTEDWRISRSLDGAPGSRLPAPRSPVVIFESDKDPLAQGWEWARLTSLAQLESGHTPRKSVPEYWENGTVPWISLQDIRAADGTVIQDTKHKPTELGIANSSARLLPAGTVCFCRDISFGYVTIMGREMSTTQHFANWVCGERLAPRYLMYAFMAGRGFLGMSGQGTTVTTIYMPALKELRLATPPIAEQHEIVRRVETFFAFADRLEARYATGRKQVDQLTPALLAKAFRGELVPQDPDDEPAAELLKRLAATRAEAPKAQRGRKAASAGATR